MTGTTVLAERITYNDIGPLFWQLTEEFTDPSCADSLPWIIRMPWENRFLASVQGGPCRRRHCALGDVGGGRTGFSSAGPHGCSVPPFFTGDATDARKIRSEFQPPDKRTLRYSYDAFGRTATISENQIPVARYRYKPLQRETQDAEQLKVGGVHSGAFSRSEMDGRGRTIRDLLKSLMETL